MYNIKYAADAAPQMPFTVDHPYLSQFGANLAGGGVGAALGAGIGALTGRQGGALLGTGIGGIAGASLGGWGTIGKHYMDRTDYSNQLRASGHSGDLPFVVAHPYLSMSVAQAAPVVGPLAAIAYHHHEKNRFQNELADRAKQASLDDAYAAGRAFAYGVYST